MGPLSRSEIKCIDLTASKQTYLLHGFFFSFVKIHAQLLRKACSAVAGTHWKTDPGWPWSIASIIIILVESGNLLGTILTTSQRRKRCHRTPEDRHGNSNMCVCAALLVYNISQAQKLQYADTPPCLLSDLQTYFFPVINNSVFTSTRGVNSNVVNV